MSQLLKKKKAIFSCSWLFYWLDCLFWFAFSILFSPKHCWAVVHGWDRCVLATLTFSWLQSLLQGSLSWKLLFLLLHLNSLWMIQVNQDVNSHLFFLKAKQKLKKQTSVVIIFQRRKVSWIKSVKRRTAGINTSWRLSFAVRLIANLNFISKLILIQNFGTPWKRCSSSRRKRGERSS